MQIILTIRIEQLLHRSHGRLVILRCHCIFETIYFVREVVDHISCYGLVAFKLGMWHLWNILVHNLLVNEILLLQKSQHSILICKCNRLIIRCRKSPNAIIIQIKATFYRWFALVR